MEFVKLFVILLIFPEEGSLNHDPEWVTAPLMGIYSDLVEYTLYSKDVTWNDAARICALDGAHILSINNQEKHDLIEEFKLKEWSPLLSHDYWSGLSEPFEHQFVWEDCTGLSSFNKFKGESYNSGELCYLIRRDSLVWESKKCDERHYFACEKNIPGGCDHATILSSNKLATYSNMTEAICQHTCSTSDSCWSGIYTDSGLCILLESRTEGETMSEVTMFKKICARVLIEVNVPTLPYENKDPQPLLNCTLSQASAVPPLAYTTSSVMTSSDLSSVISPTPCYQYETINITNIENITQTINITHIDMVNVTTWINVTETVNEIITSFLIEPITTTITDNVNTLLYITSTITETYNLTEIHNYTSTIYDSQCSSSCFNATNHYISPSDPLLLEAIASMEKELTIDKKETSSHIRKLTSAPDSRTSSQVIGMTGLVFIIVPLGIIILGDIPAVLRSCGASLKMFRAKNIYKT